MLICLHRSRPCLCIIGGSRPYLSFLGVNRLDLDLGNELKPVKRSFHAGGRSYDSEVRNCLPENLLARAFAP